MRKLIWVCDACGFEKDMSSAVIENVNLQGDIEEKDIEELADGWITIHHYENGVCGTLDLCPKCSDKIVFNNNI